MGIGNCLVFDGWLFKYPCKQYMPDLITHTIIARLIASFKWRRFALWFAIGAILPDLLTRAPMFFLRGCYRCGWFFIPLHTPLVLILVNLLFASFFANKRRLINKTIFWSLFFGSGSHLLLDFLQKHIKDGYYYLFPLSFKSLEAGWFWPEDSLKFLPALIFLFLGFIIAERIWRKQKS